jgi:hypothetical protein
LKLSTPKDPATAEKAAKSSKSKAPKGEEQGASTPKQTPKPIDPQEAKERKEKESMGHSRRFFFGAVYMLIVPSSFHPS